MSDARLYLDVPPPGPHDRWAKDVKVPVGPIRVNQPDGSTVERTVIYTEYIDPVTLRLWFETPPLASP